MNKRLPWFHCYPDKLLGGIAGLTPDQKLVYLIVLLRIYEVRGPCPDTLCALAVRVGINKRRISEALNALYLAGKLASEPGGIINPFAVMELTDAEALRRERARAGAGGGSSTAKIREQNQQTTPSKRGSKPAANATYLRVKKEEEEIVSKQDPVEAKEASTASPPPFDIRRELFQRGLATFRRISGKLEGPSRALIGKWLRDCDDDAVVVLRAIEDAAMSHIDGAGVVAWINGAIRSRTGGRYGENRQGGGVGFGALAERIRAGTTPR